MICPNCAYNDPEGAEYCPSCNYKLTPAEPKAAAEAIPPLAKAFPVPEAAATEVTA